MNHHQTSADLSDDLSDDSLFEPIMTDRTHSFPKNSSVRLSSTSAQMPAPNRKSTVAKQKTRRISGSIVDFVLSIVGSVVALIYGLSNRVIPPDQRAAMMARIKAFMAAYPITSAFLGVNLAFTGIPLVLFMTFSLSVLVSSIAVGLAMALLGAIGFTLFCVGVALCVVFPIALFTTSVACFLFFWGLVAYFSLRWLAGNRINNYIEARNSNRQRPNNNVTQQGGNTSQSAPQRPTDNERKFNTKSNADNNFHIIYTPQSSDSIGEKHHTGTAQESAISTSQIPIHAGQTYPIDGSGQSGVVDNAGSAITTNNTLKSDDARFGFT